jgi:hypothetical protein
MRELMPGELVVVRPGALVRLHSSEAEHYTLDLQAGLVIQKTNQWNDGEVFNRLAAIYLVLFSNDSKMYHVNGDWLDHPDVARDPSRLFGRLSS